MDNKKAIEIITEYVFGDYKLESLYKFVKAEDDREKKLYAEALLTEAMKKAVVALSENRH